MSSPPKTNFTNIYDEDVPDSIPAALEGYKEFDKKRRRSDSPRGIKNLFKFMLAACLVRDGKAGKRRSPRWKRPTPLVQKTIRGERLDGLDRTAFAQPLRPQQNDGRQEWPKILPGITRRYTDSFATLAEKQRYAIGANVRYETGTGRSRRIGALIRRSGP